MENGLPNGPFPPLKLKKKSEPSLITKYVTIKKWISPSNLLFLRNFYHNQCKETLQLDHYVFLSCDQKEIFWK